MFFTLLCWERKGSGVHGVSNGWQLYKTDLYFVLGE